MEGGQMEGEQMKTPSTILCWLLTACLLTACIHRFEPVKLTGLPVDVSQPDAQEVDVDLIFTNAESRAKKVLPESYLTFLGFSGSCHELPRLRGTIRFWFTEVRGILGRQVLLASVSVNTISETMSLEILDISDYYPSIVPLRLQGSLPITEIAAIAYNHIISLGLSECDVGLSRLRDSWLVECTFPGSGLLGHRLCEFEIDPFTGQVRDAQR